ncbi:antiviral RADAR system adenosine triphosphatase RdrA [Salinivibrio proteolyticus]|uniref:KAP NTPase domain-containing protein n=1 Tax=Salinivibrio proteolyticus TaxID=334715 RepID=A0ABY7LFV2_9GAMM|nr:antiviral RADAR system adenosine triphosphatase RdrA [Salinivibrio proteolyticus]WBA15492.1 hypothetical protein N7E60_04135 [Salinivibrio proteolyticus]
MSVQADRYISLDSVESAVFESPATLLPLSVYQTLATFIKEALHKVPTTATEKDINSIRSHNAVSIDGDRGTGKTSVLVNLQRYLEQDHPQVLKDVFILEPVDPTLIEDHESLFLHVIVASILSDKTVQEKQCSNRDASTFLNRKLDALATALESVESQKTAIGMDKLRALFGNKRLADSVQEFFQAVLNLLGKKLLVLPIDDVDTSLNRAFENLEIIRRYLTTPYVLPIVSGDRSLNQEVTWRDFHGRLIRDSRHKSDAAYEIAVDLAQEYQRKVLPLPNRITMPSVKEFLNDPTIQLSNTPFSDDTISLRNFRVWLEIFLAGPTNGLENSRLEIPIGSIRELTQLVRHCRELIPQLPAPIKEANSELEVRRAWQMPNVSQQTLRKFHEFYIKLSKEKKRRYGAAYEAFSEATSEANPNPMNFSLQHRKAWNESLLNYFKYEAKAGVSVLVLQASRDWLSRRNGNEFDKDNSIFNTPLFQPLEQNKQKYRLFEKRADFSEWLTVLQNMAPPGWLKRLEERRTILPYPVAEVGIEVGTRWKFDEKIFDKFDPQPRSKAKYLLLLTEHYNFYSSNKRSLVMTAGRAFEIIISSLIGDLRQEDIEKISRTSPFYSTSSLAPTKVFAFDEKNEKNSINDENETRSSYVEWDDSIDAQIDDLASEIKEWRENHNMQEQFPSPWLIYKVFNKVLTQIHIYEKTIKVTPENYLNEALKLVGYTFYSTWSAFASFEKGRLFGLPEVVASSNLSRTSNFEKNDHFTYNIAPFVAASTMDEEASKHRNAFGKATETATYFLANHPLKTWIDEALDSVQYSHENQANKQDDEARRWLTQRLGLPRGKIRSPKSPRLVKILEDMQPQEANDLLIDMEKRFSKTIWLNAVESIVNKANNG